jgi:hypothetical protein
LSSSVGLQVVPEEAFRDSGFSSIVIPSTVRIVEKRAFYGCYSLIELDWSEGSKVEMIEEEAFENTQLKKLVILGSLEYIGARMCPVTTKLLLTSESMIRMFEEWERLFLQNRNHVMGKRIRYEMEEEEEDKEDDGEDIDE